MNCSINSSLNFTGKKENVQRDGRTRENGYLPSLETKKREEGGSFQFFFPGRGKFNRALSAALGVDGMRACFREGVRSTRLHTTKKERGQAKLAADALLYLKFKTFPPS